MPTWSHHLGFGQREEPLRGIRLWFAEANRDSNATKVNLYISLDTTTHRATNDPHNSSKEVPHEQRTLRAHEPSSVPLASTYTTSIYFWYNAINSSVIDGVYFFLLIKSTFLKISRFSVERKPTSV